MNSRSMPTRGEALEDALSALQYAVAVQRRQPVRRGELRDWSWVFREATGALASVAGELRARMDPGDPATGAELAALEGALRAALARAEVLHASAGRGTTATAS